MNEKLKIIEKLTPCKIPTSYNVKRDGRLCNNQQAWEWDATYYATLNSTRDAYFKKFVQGPIIRHL